MKTVRMIAPARSFPQVAVVIPGSTDKGLPEQMEVYGGFGDYAKPKIVPSISLLNAGYLLFATPREWNETWVDARRLSDIALRLKATRSPEIIRTR